MITEEMNLKITRIHNILGTSNNSTRPSKTLIKWTWEIYNSIEYSRNEKTRIEIRKKNISSMQNNKIDIEQKKNKG